MSPFEALYGHIPYLSKESNIAKVYALLCSKEDTIQVLWRHLLRAQQRMKLMAN